MYCGITPPTLDLRRSLCAALLSTSPHARRFGPAGVHRPPLACSGVWDVVSTVEGRQCVPGHGVGTPSALRMSQMAWSERPLARIAAIRALRRVSRTTEPLVALGGLMRPGCQPAISVSVRIASLPAGVVVS